MYTYIYSPQGPYMARAWTLGPVPVTSDQGSPCKGPVNYICMYIDVCI